MPDELYAEPVIGYRSWTVCPTTYRLRSRIIRDTYWPTESECVAKCSDDTQFKHKTDKLLPDQHPAPQFHCSCGLYAFHELYDAVDKYGSGDRTVIGSCVFWGKIVVCTAGFRAQYGRIVALTAYRKREKIGDLSWPSLLEQVVEKYNVPVLPLNLLEEYTNTWGKPLAL